MSQVEDLALRCICSRPGKVDDDRHHGCRRHRVVGSSSPVATQHFTRSGSLYRHPAASMLRHHVIVDSADIGMGRSGHGQQPALPKYRMLAIRDKAPSNPDAAGALRRRIHPSRQCVGSRHARPHDPSQRCAGRAIDAAPQHKPPPERGFSRLRDSFSGMVDNAVILTSNAAEHAGSFAAGRMAFD